jgi:hypothetical protein
VLSEDEGEMHCPLQEDMKLESDPEDYTAINEGSYVTRS